MTVLFLAPHFEYPPRLGSNVYIERLARYLSGRRGDVHLLGANEQFLFRDMQLMKRETYGNEPRSKYMAALRTVLRGSHYYAERFLTSRFCERAASLIPSHRDSLVICSYLVTASLLPGSQFTSAPIVLTHNNEILWFQNQRRYSRNPLQKWVSLSSERWVRRFLKLECQKFIYGQITEEDERGYRKYFPDLRALIIPAGVEIGPLSLEAAWDGCIRLLFCGALSVNMNLDALVFFRDRFWRRLNDGLHEKMEVWVAGSNPSRAIRNLCREQGWQLYPNLSDEALHGLYGKATFGILPFPYTTGAKLKLLNSLAAGLPVLGTNNMNIMAGQDFLPNLYSDEPDDWRAHLLQYAEHGIGPNDRFACQQFVSRFNWQSIVNELDDNLERLGT